MNISIYRDYFVLNVITQLKCSEAEGRDDHCHRTKYDGTILASISFCIKDLHVTICLKVYICLYSNTPFPRYGHHLTLRLTTCNPLSSNSTGESSKHIIRSINRNLERSRRLLIRALDTITRNIAANALYARLTSTAASTSRLARRVYTSSTGSISRVNEAEVLAWFTNRHDNVIGVLGFGLCAGGRSSAGCRTSGVVDVGDGLGVGSGGGLCARKDIYNTITVGSSSGVGVAGGRGRR